MIYQILYKHEPSEEREGFFDKHLVHSNVEKGEAAVAKAVKKKSKGSCKKTIGSRGCRDRQKAAKNGDRQICQECLAKHSWGEVGNYEDVLQSVVARLSAERKMAAAEPEPEQAEKHE
ncbi:hypothetical protein KJ903_01210 [Patescibacteria group bacterium]|nr:hypothetical protein [Patescibacteria group bacterium]